MILEHALLDVDPARAAEYEAAFQKALPLIAATPGFLDLTLNPCMEKPGRYLLLVKWETLENHTRDFRGSERYQQWKALLHGFYEPFPEVTHYAEPVHTAPINVISDLIRDPASSTKLDSGSRPE